MEKWIDDFRYEPIRLTEILTWCDKNNVPYNDIFISGNEHAQVSIWEDAEMTDEKIQADRKKEREQREKMFGRYRNMV
jgi:hypothetical protein